MFVYMRWIVDVIDAFCLFGVGIDALHFGGGAFVLLCYFVVTWLVLWSEVFELDFGVVQIVKEHFKLRPLFCLKVWIGDVVELLRGKFGCVVDFVIGDVFDGLYVFVQLFGDVFVVEVCCVFKFVGVYVLNVIDVLLLDEVCIYVVALRKMFVYFLWIVFVGVLRVCVLGNVVFVVSDVVLLEVVLWCVVIVVVLCE